ncbi:response regulator [Glaciibacter psychrotolerans]|uniref:DNA-binding NarL/FixJ family response regulator n=1 Tax=Glaciibacter psychrotolerans TaxID=670054 RepID=A0A7Z0EHM8_9MICO|nr:response regulator transcription factor [Leifsonia psychrotolerans]NYJ21092.1 DNA-binding NarL/FixJ family response regulator [Leifsonia psychrotolerans]
MSAPAPATAPIRVVVVDDQALFVSGMQMLIESQADLACVGTAPDGRMAVEVVGRERPDVVLMDIRMPVLDGIEATARILQQATAQVAAGETVPRIIMLTTFQRDEAVFRAIRTGASGFITKDATPEFILAAIRTVHAGQAVLAPQATFDLVRQFATEASDAGRPLELAIDVLSPREREIFLLTARGLSNAEIATAAFVSEATVKTHVRSILAKLHLQSRVQVVIFAYENGLLRY